MNKKRVFFSNAFGEQLAGDLVFPVGKPRAFALFAHCFTCGKDIKTMSYLTTAINQQGYAILKFDFTGLGASKGNFADTNFSTNVLDLIKAAEFLSENYQAPQFLVGHSLGGAAVLEAASCIPSVRAVATIGAPSDPLHVKHLISQKETEILEKGMAEVELAGRKFVFKKQFIENLQATNLKDKIGKLNAALLVLHSPIDAVVGIENAQEIYTAAKHPKSFISLDKADHLLLKEEDALFAGNMIASWAQRYIDSNAGDDQLEESEVLYTRTQKGGFQTEIHIGKHPLIADEPASVGGTETGPTPYGYLSAALGACTSMTLIMYADRKKWPLENATVYLTHDKTYHQDCVSCEEKPQKIDTFRREVVLEGNLSQEQRQRLLEIADKCPVHRTLHSEVVITTELKEL